MAKNIVLCSDGTGNKGGSGSDTNVFKVYNVVQVNDLPAGQRAQVVFYDNGVGTSKLSLQKALGGGLGLGFRQNVRDLYEFLGRNYRPEDDIYLFGFSRGAATVRAFAGMLEHCGLVVKHRPGKAGDIDEPTFQKLVDDAMKYYVNRARTKKLGFEDGTKVKVEFMGVWDTVAALGTPQLPWLGSFVNLFRHHKFYDYEPATCVRSVYHAIAIDDERRTFWPLVWNEKGFKGGGAIEQVWFSGMHSNVGGGYPREELAQVTLDWMMQKLEEHWTAVQKADSTRGLSLKGSPRDEARADANTFGKLYDSRAGFSIFYRYQPRPIEELCRGKAPIRIHKSVLDRLGMRTAGYTPGNLPGPGQFQEVATRLPDHSSTSGGGSPSAGNTVPEAEEITQGDHSPPDQPDRPAEGPPVSDTVSAETYASVRTGIDRLRDSRITLYWVFLMSSLAVVAGSLVLWLRPPSAGPTGTSASYEAWQEASSVLHWVEAGLRYVLPTFFDGAITYLVIEHPWRLAFLVVYALILYSIRVSLQMAMERREERARHVLLKLLDRST